MLFDTRYFEIRGANFQFVIDASCHMIGDVMLYDDTAAAVHALAAKKKKRGRRGDGGGRGGDL